MEGHLPANGKLHEPTRSASANTAKPDHPNDQSRKVAAIYEACDAHDFRALTRLAVSSCGLVHDTARQRAWPILLGSDQTGLSDASASKPQHWESLPEHKDERQVQLDVDRAFIYYPSSESPVTAHLALAYSTPPDISPKELDRRKDQLSALITSTLRCHPHLNYFQGYHDIAQVFLLVLGPTLSPPALARLSLLRIRDFMLPSLQPSLAHLLLLPPLLCTAEPRLHNYISHSQPFFALAATLTLYAHDIQEYSDIARLFDALLAREPVFSIYLFAQTVLLRKDELFDIGPDEPEMLHAVLSKLPHPLDLEALLDDATSLFERFPPESLRPWRRLSSASVLKTARHPEQAAAQKIEEGERLLEVQEKQLRREEILRAAQAQLWKYRRPAVTAGLTVLVGILSWWIRKNDGVANGLLAALTRRLNALWVSVT
ncbi:MAG: hypothetical protein M1833_000509 [Piccolia ochrophora]|nr:MAG: hypothetical protein M1833_000509 [Piccolia ochrophora]